MRGRGADTVDPPHLVTAARMLLETALDRPATLDTGRLVCVDGPAGSGKTTLGTLVARDSRLLVPSVRLIHMDDLYEGWAGLGDVATRVRDDLIEPLRAGRSGRYRRWDWLEGAWAEEHVVDPTALLVIEGVGSGAVEYADAIGALGWVSAPSEIRLGRGLDRDGESMRADWERWMIAEDALFAAQRTRERADVVVDGTGATPPQLTRA